MRPHVSRKLTLHFKSHNSDFSDAYHCANNCVVQEYKRAAPILTNMKWSPEGTTLTLPKHPAACSQKFLKHTSLCFRSVPVFPWAEIHLNSTSAPSQKQDVELSQSNSANSKHTAYLCTFRHAPARFDSYKRAFSET